MRAISRLILGLQLASTAFILAGCESTPQGIQAAKTQLAARYAAETPGDYYIGRRYYKPDYKFWGYVRRPGEPWSTSKMVMLNEKRKLAPDREHLSFGSDNNYEYKLFGHFSGETVYEPASNGFYPEFVLERYEVLSTNPPPIFASQVDPRIQAQTTRYTIEKPQM